MSKSVKVVANALAFTCNGKIIEDIGNGPKTLDVGTITLEREQKMNLQGEDEMLKW